MLEKKYLNEKEVAFTYSVTRSWLQRERWKGTGPKYIKVNGTGKVLYPSSVTETWFENCGLRQSTSGPSIAITANGGNTDGKV